MQSTDLNISDQDIDDTDPLAALNAFVLGIHGNNNRYAPPCEPSHVLDNPASHYGELVVAHAMLVSKLDQLDAVQPTGPNETLPPYFRERKHAMKEVCQGLAERLEKLQAEREAHVSALPPAAPSPAIPLTPDVPKAVIKVFAKPKSSVVEEPLAEWVKPLLPLCRVWATGFTVWGKAILSVKRPEQG